MARALRIELAGGFYKQLEAICTRLRRGRRRKYQTSKA